MSQFKKHSHGYDRLTDRELLEKVKRGWNCEETPCGSGSTLGQTGRIRRLLPGIVKKYEIKTVSDSGAGDLNWITKTKWDVEYQGYDLYPRHPDVIQFDATKKILPRSDLIICRHVLNHLSIEFMELMVDNFFLSESRYVLVTNCENQQDYWNQYQFCMGEPIETFGDTNQWWLELYANPLC